MKARAGAHGNRRTAKMAVRRCHLIFRNPFAEAHSRFADSKRSAAGHRFEESRVKAAEKPPPATKARRIMHKAQFTNPAISVVSPGATILTRELLVRGGAASLVHRDEPDVRLLSDEQRRTSLDTFMKSRPAGDLWIFAYGSLIWNPALRISERRVAEIHGWHRSFCLSMSVGRGTPGQPGLVLGLDRGGACKGVAYRIDERDVSSELPILWSREMLVGGYNPIWTDLIGDGGEKFGAAIIFTIDQGHDNYAGGISLQEKVRRLAIAEGSWGSSADYLFRTIGGLREHGIHDVEIEHLGVMVASAAFEAFGEAA